MSCEVKAFECNWACCTERVKEQNLILATFFTVHQLSVWPLQGACWGSSTLASFCSSKMNVTKAFCHCHLLGSSADAKWGRLIIKKWPCERNFHQRNCTAILWETPWNSQRHQNFCEENANSTCCIWIRSNRMQQYAGVYVLQNYSTCFGCPSHPSSGVHKTVTAASGTGHITYPGNNLPPAWPN